MSDSGEPQALDGAAYEAPPERSNEDVTALFKSLKLQQGHYQRFARRRTASAPLQVAEIIRSERKAQVRTDVGIFSPAGGSGKSLIASGLGSILCQRGKLVLLIDASPWPTLAFHFGAAEARPGNRTFSAPGSHKTPLHLFTCGEAETALRDVEQFSGSIAPDYVIYDLSGVSGDRLLSYLRQCDRVLVPLLPDPSALRIAAGVVSMIDSLGASAPQVSFILNNMDDSGASRETQEALAQILGKQLIPSAIPNQTEVRQALQAGIVFPFYAPEAQASLILGDVAKALAKPEKIALAASSRWIEG